MKKNILILLVLFINYFITDIAAQQLPSRKLQTTAVENQVSTSVKLMSSVITGQIQLYDSYYNEMKEENGNRPPEGSMIKVSLWNYINSPDPANAQRQRIYLTSEVKDIEISFQKMPNAIAFTINNKPRGNYMLVAWFTSIPAKYSRASLSDNCFLNGAFTRPALLSSNTKQQLGNSIVYGLQTIIGNNTKPVQFVSNFIDGSGNMTVNIFEDIVDFIGDAATWVFEAGKTLAGIALNAAGSIVMTVGSTVITLIQSGELPKFREMTQGEYDWANAKIFNGTLPSKASIAITNLMGFSRRAFTIPNGFGMVYMNLGDAYHNPVEFKTTSYNEQGQLFIHELTHAWQIAHNEQLKLFGQGIANQWEYTVMGDKSVYEPNFSASWNDNNFEQQGSIVDRCYKDVYFNKEAKRCGSGELMVVNNIRSGKHLPFPNPAYKKTELAVTGNRSISGYFTWGDYNTSLPAGVRPEDVFEFEVKTPLFRYEKLEYGCVTTSNISFGEPQKINPISYFRAPVTEIINGRESISKVTKLHFRISNLPDGLPVYISAKNITNWEPGSLSSANKPQGSKVGFNITLTEPATYPIAMNQDNIDYKVTGNWFDYGIIPPNSKQKGMGMPNIKSDGPLNQSDIEKKTTTPILKSDTPLKNNLPSQQKINVQQKVQVKNGG